MNMYTTMKIKPNQLQHYNNLMYNNIVFKLARVNAKDLFNNTTNETIFSTNIDRLNGTNREIMLQELTILHRLLLSYSTVKKDFNIKEFCNDANYSVSVSFDKNIPIYAFSTKGTNINIIQIVDILDKCDNSKYVADRVKESLEALTGFKKLGKQSNGKKK